LVRCARSFDLGRSEQGTLDLHEMQVGELVDAGIGRSALHRVGGGVDLRAAADLVRREVAGEGHAEREPPAAVAGRRVAGRRVVGRAPREHAQVRRQHALGPARHHQRDACLDLRHRQAEMAAEQRGDRHARIFAGEVVDAAIALGLAEHRDHVGRSDAAAVEQCRQPGDVARPAAGDAKDLDLLPPHVRDEGA
jgi:hypothetical protein